MRRASWRAMLLIGGSVLVSAPATAAAQEVSVCPNETTAPMNGSPNPDALVGTNAVDRILAGDGDDDVTALQGDDCIHGGPGFDTVQAGQGDDFIFGEDTEDDLSGGSGEDS